MDIKPGTTFNGLKILALCGCGAYGEVYYCEDISGRHLALKVISKHRLGDTWKRELQGTANYLRITATSPHLLQIFHVAEDEDTFYYTMEAADNVGSGDRYIPDTLAQRLRNGALPPEQLYPILRGIFDGIKTIHDAGFAHRDIKPDNILFVGGIPKLGDIGLLSSLSNSMTKLAGTLDFLPPEVRSSPGSADRASRQRGDLYAFGKVIYCAATGLDPSMFPSWPSQVGLSSPAQKFFFGVSLRLCAAARGLRVASIAALERDIEQIERDLNRDAVHYPLSWHIRHSIDVLWKCLRQPAFFLVLFAIILAVGTAASLWLIGKGKAENPSAHLTNPPMAMSAPDKTSAADIYDMSNKKVTEIHIGGGEISESKYDDFLDAEVETPGTWFFSIYPTRGYSELFLYKNTDDPVAISMQGMRGMRFCIDNRYASKADSHIQLWASLLISANKFQRYSDEQLKSAIQKDFYLEYALPNTNFATEVVSKSASVSSIFYDAQTFLPEESIRVGEIKRFTVSGQPAIYTEIDSPRSHGGRKLLYCLVAVKGLNNCTVILLDADMKKADMRTKQFFEFLRHITIFLK